MPSKRMSSACVDYVPALCTHRPSLLPIEWLGEAFGLAQGGRQRPPRAGKLVKPGHLEENSVNHRIFERTLRPLVFRGACLFERHFTTQASLGIGQRGPPRASNRPAGSSDVIEGENPVCGRKGALYVAPSTSRVVWECSSKWEGRDCNQTCSRCSAGLLTGLLAALQASIVWCRWIRLEECSSLGSVIASCDAASAGRELAMRDEPNARLRCRNVRLSDTTKGVSSSRQQDGGHGSRNPLRSV
uniref:Uncharacterized protein n=1 Tax=Quercus lobata TaxID=97700 RepID=A0A7N2N6G4_QUELO